MKTPKEILLEAHQAMEPRLDRVREDVLAAELRQTVSPQQKRPNIFTAVPIKLWNELIWPSRQAWAGLAAVWVALAAVHFSQRDSGASSKSAPDPQMMAMWYDQRQWLLEQRLDERRQVAEKRPVPTAPPTASGKSAESYSFNENDWA